MSRSLRTGTEICICLPFWKEATEGQTQSSVKLSVWGRAGRKQDLSECTWFYAFDFGAKCFLQ